MARRVEQRIEGDAADRAAADNLRKHAKSVERNELGAYAIAVIDKRGQLRIQTWGFRSVAINGQVAEAMRDALLQLNPEVLPDGEEFIDD